MSVSALKMEVRPSDVLKKYGIKRYNTTKPEFRGSMDMDAFVRNRQLLPVSYLGTNEKKAHLIKTNPFFMKGQSYSAFPSLEDLVSVICELPPESRILSTMVLPRECQLYFDLDGEIGCAPGRPDFLKDKIAVLDALWYFVALAIQKLLGRMPFGSLVGERPRSAAEFEACTPTKFSVHVHYPYEGFTHIDEIKAFILLVLFPIIQKAAIEDDPQALLIGYWSEEKPKNYSTYYQHVASRGYFHVVMDIAVYTKNRVFRLPGCCKPGGATLRFFRGPDELKDNFSEQVRWGLISHSLPTVENQLINVTSILNGGGVQPYFQHRPKSSFGSKVQKKTGVALHSIERKMRISEGEEDKSSVPAYHYPRVIVKVDNPLPASECLIQKEITQDLVRSMGHKVDVWSKFECNAYFIQGYFKLAKGTKCQFHRYAPRFTCPMKVHIQFRSELETEMVVCCKYADKDEHHRRNAGSHNIDKLFPARNLNQDVIDPLQFANLFFVE